MSDRTREMATVRENSRILDGYLSLIHISEPTRRS